MKRGSEGAPSVSRPEKPEQPGYTPESFNHVKCKPMPLLFIELGGPAAQKRLERLERELLQRDPAANCQLLRSSEEANLFLLVYESAEVLEAGWPAASRIWRFEKT